MAKNSRVPGAVGAIPVVGDLLKQADGQAQWLQDLVEQNSRLVGQLPATMKNFNDTLERFNQTVARLDAMVTRVEATANQLIGPLDQVDKMINRLDLPQLADTLRKEALPALRAATDTQKQVAVLTSTIDRVVTLLAELPGMGLMRRFTGAGKPDQPPGDPIP
jgi:ABC-type transporter Mla subunit MlaD